MLHPVHITRLPAIALGLLTLLAVMGGLWATWGAGEGYAGLGQYDGTYAQTPNHVTIAGDLPIETYLPFARQALTPDQALAINLSSPLEPVNPLPPAFLPAWLSNEELTAATQCMANAIYYEAASEPDVGQRAVAQVILNRLRHPRYPKTVCGVVYEGAEKSLACQFTFACDGSTRRRPDPAGLARARLVADAALHGATSSLAGQATHYHTTAIVPLWAHEMRKVAMISHHVFYRPPSAYGGWPISVAKAPAFPVEAAAPPPAPVKAETALVGVWQTPDADLHAVAEPDRSAPQPQATPPAESAPRPFFPDPRRRRNSYALPSH
jgi:hypothetical protein